MSDEAFRIRELETRAAKLKGLLGLEFARRAFVLEFAGTPKSGKSTSVEAVRHFFSRNGYRVHVLAERAAMCPIPMKGHLFFNTWCMASMLAELLANVETETDLIIVDRGLMDSLVWLVMQKNRGEISSEEATSFERFALLPRWTSLIDLALVMYVDPKEALDRERKQRIATKDGSIMNTSTLETISESVSQAVELYSKSFKKLLSHDSTGSTVRSYNIKIIEEILDQFEEFLDPKILVVERDVLVRSCVPAIGCFGETEVQRIMGLIQHKSSVIRRSEAESNTDLVQIISCSMITQGTNVFIFERHNKDSKSLYYGKLTLWYGSHIAEGPGAPFDGVLKAGRDRVNEALFLGQNLSFEPIGFCWREKENHLGVILKVEIENPLTIRDLEKKEYRRSRGFGLSGKLVEWSELFGNLEAYKLEPWSIEIVRSYGARVAEAV